MSWKKLICQSVGQEQLSDIQNFILHEDINKKSAIDCFYEESRAIIRATPTSLTPTDWIGPMHVVALVSITENFFRMILGDILKICHVTKKNAANNNISFGSVLWHPDESISRGAFEHLSFSDSSKIIETTRKYVGAEIKKELGSILEEFTKVCELRHGIVHSGRYIAGKNALILDLPSSNKSLKICIGYGQLQSIAAVCTTLVVSYNQIMFELICKRWAVDWRGFINWSPDLEDHSMKQIWAIFHSKIDQTDGNIEEKGSWIKCRNLIKREFNLT